MEGGVEEAGAGLTESALERCRGVSLSFAVGAGSGEVEEFSLGEGSDDLGTSSSCSSTSMGFDGASETPSSSPFTSEIGAASTTRGEGGAVPADGDGLILSKLCGSCFNESSRMGDISCTRAFSMPSDRPGLASAGVPEPGETPQSSRSGRLSSSSPAQSIWLPGVDGRWSMAKARTCSTSESMFVFVEKDVTVGPAERCGGASFDAEALGGA